MMIVGLTGGIGSGKSTVAKMFMDLGIPVYDSDKEAKELMVTSEKVRVAIIELLGNSAYNSEGLDRSYIADKVFKDSELLEKLNGIVHPAVREHFLNWAKKQKSPYVVQETALIFENDAQDKYDCTILVTAPLNSRIQRVVQRDGTSEKAVKDRMNNQLEDSHKKKLADFNIENLDLDKTKEKVKELHLKLLALAQKF
ncbi:dephospho-CoA kinase [Muricauda oceani]|uniref:Dephospho-CoA kinase n=1 Tax=Flagellimonas oceani TaxID=2698672 RepID=A0A6G7J2Q4_9FLAO|nr:dephospho-CoA kinase [Allomuricauda oceani]MBW8241239.1 dephospho-CoA kinase [Allomuricauda oceani]QII44757.1 dephospho-CoA kinase [Allomuricauda oceani]